MTEEQLGAEDKVGPKGMYFKREDNEVEGQGFRVANRPDDESDEQSDEVEGHGSRLLNRSDEDDDVEGHGARLL